MISAIVTLIFNIALAVAKFAFKVVKKVLFATGLIVPLAAAAVFALLFGLGAIEYTPISLAFAGVLCEASFLCTVYLFLRKKFLGRLPERRLKAPDAAEPRVYRVKQNPRYIMYEYPDRVELYEETGKGRRYIRTDKRRF